MGMLVEGDNVIRGLWSALNDAAELGTGDTQETAQDSDLQTPISGSEVTSLTNTTEDQYLKKQAVFPGTSSGDESVTEMIWKKSSPEKAGSRITFKASTWQATGDLKISTRWYFKGKLG